MEALKIESAVTRKTEADSTSGHKLIEPYLVASEIVVVVGIVAAAAAAAYFADWPDSDRRNSADSVRFADLAD